MSVGPYFQIFIFTATTKQTKSMSTHVSSISVAPCFQRCIFNPPPHHYHNHQTKTTFKNGLPIYQPFLLIPVYRDVSLTSPHHHYQTKTTFKNGLPMYQPFLLIPVYRDVSLTSPHHHHHQTTTFKNGLPMYQPFVLVPVSRDVSLTSPHHHHHHHHQTKTTFKNGLPMYQSPLLSFLPVSVTISGSKTQRITEVRSYMPHRPQRPDQT